MNATRSLFPRFSELLVNCPGPGSALQKSSPHKYEPVPKCGGVLIIMVQWRNDSLYGQGVKYKDTFLMKCSAGPFVPEDRCLVFTLQFRIVFKTIELSEF